MSQPKRNPPHSLLQIDASRLEYLVSAEGGSLKLHLGGDSPGIIDVTFSLAQALDVGRSILRRAEREYSKYATQPAGRPSETADAMKTVTDWCELQEQQGRELRLTLDALNAQMRELQGLCASASPMGSPYRERLTLDAIAELRHWLHDFDEGQKAAIEVNVVETCCAIAGILPERPSDPLRDGPASASDGSPLADGICTHTTTLT